MLELYGLIQSMRPDQHLDLSRDKAGNVVMTVIWSSETPQEQRETSVIHKYDICEAGDKAIIDCAKIQLWQH